MVDQSKELSEELIYKNANLTEIVQAKQQELERMRKEIERYESMNAENDNVFSHSLIIIGIKSL